MYLPSSCSALFYGHSGFLWSRGFCSSTHAGKCCSHLFCGRYKIVSFVWTMNTYYLEFNQNCPLKICFTTKYVQKSDSLFCLTADNVVFLHEMTSVYICHVSVTLNHLALELIYLAVFMYNKVKGFILWQGLLLCFFHVKTRLSYLQIF